MTPGKKRARRQRVKKMNAILHRLYPDVCIALNYSNPFELLVAVQLSAQCTDKRVNEVTERLFRKYQTLEAYVNARQPEFERDIFACGFYRNKARNILAAAKLIHERFGGRVPHTMAELLTVPGIGRKTANVILSNLYDTHEGIAVDTHVRRFAIRFDLTDYTDPVHIERDLMELMPKEEWWGFNHRLVWYGREVCPARKHDCFEHPLTKVYPKAAQIWPAAR